MSDATAQIFVGGWKNTGTRLVCRLLSQRGFDCLEGLTNPMLDYRGMEFRSLFKALKLFDDPTLISRIKSDTAELDRWVVKHGHLMLIVPLLKREFPACKFICCVRNPFDIIFKGEDLNYLEFGLSHTTSPPPLEKLRTIRSWYEAALPHIDLMVKLEDLVFDKAATIRRIFRFAGCDEEPTLEDLAVVGDPSPTIGAGVGAFDPEETGLIQEYAERLGY